MVRFLLATVGVMVLGHSASASSLVAFRFNATLAWEAELFGQLIGANDSVSGRVVYRMDAPASTLSAPCGDCTGYPVDLLNGFSLEIGSLLLRYDSYQAAVYNDGPGLVPETLEDVLSFGRNESLPASYARGLLVNGSPHPSAYMDLALVAPSVALSSSALPSDPQPGTFFIGNLLISDGVQFVAGFVDPISLERIPTLEGDYYSDGEIDAADYAVWRDELGSALPSSDGNCDGVVDAADYTIYRDALDVTSVAVPEPGGVLAASILALLPTTRRRETRAF